MFGIDLQVIVGVIVAFVSGGALVRIIELLANRSKSIEDLSASERDNLRKDIAYLRTELDKLRGRIESLESDIAAQRRRVARWQRAYWHIKIRADRLVDHLESSPQLLKMQPDLARLILAYKEHEEEYGPEELE